MSEAARGQRRRLEWGAVAVVVAGAAALRLIGLGAVRLDPFYDGAVRSMGTSWHNFFFGAWEPGGSVSIDKPPVDLWLQVGSVKLFGWGSTALKLPQALASTAAVGLLYLAIRRVWGFAAAIGAALALAVTPIDVISARSDTMDSVMMALLVLALLLLVRACESGRIGWLLAAAATLGVAFDVKLLESAVALPGLGLIALLGFRRRERTATQAGADTAESAPPTPTPTPAAAAAAAPAYRRGVLAARVLPLAAATAVFVAVALSWLTATLLYPAHERPWAIGSTNGSAWNAAFVFNGWDRITGKAMEVGEAGAGRVRRAPPQATLSQREQVSIPGPSAGRLLSDDGPLSYERLGLEALVALLLGVPAVALGWRAGGVRRATGAGLAVWLLTGLVLFSQMTRLHARYVEAFTPAVAALLGIGVATIAAVAGRRWAPARAIVFVLLLAAVLAIPLRASVRAVRLHVSDAGIVGSMPQAEVLKLSNYLRANRAGARYEVALDSATTGSSLIVRDALPVVVLTTYQGRQFTSVAQLERLIAHGEVRYALLTSLCGPHTARTGAACSPAALWVQRHARDVSRRAGLERPGTLWQLPEQIA